MAEYRERSVDHLIAKLITELPGLLIVGPRATGKTTTAARHSASVVRLDQPAQAVAFRADPDAALRGLTEPVLLDEWQAVPELLGAVKRSIDSDPHPGRYILTGSVRADLESATWPGTGRLVRVPIHGMTVGEQRGRPRSEPLVDRLARNEEPALPSDRPDLRDYVELALHSGFPEPSLSLSEGTRQRWLESYVDQLVTRDAREIAARDPARLLRYLEAYALNSAGTVDDKTLLEAAGINRRTASAYEQLLVNLMVVDAVPAWTSNRLKRLVLSRKRYLVDAALVAAALRVDVNGVMRDGDLLGRVLDTFVASQLRGQIAITSARPRLHHLRQEQGRREVDLIAELGGGRIIGIEVKASSSPGTDAARHLVWLRDQLGDRFVAGIVLHTGPRAYQLGRLVIAVPICTLWA